MRIHTSRLKITIALAVVIAIVSCGTAIQFVSHAATSIITAESENGTLNAPAQIMTDALASGGKAVRFAQPAGGFQSNCIIKPSACGYPDETNTGVQAGTAMTNSGSITVTVPGTVISGKNITGQIVINANNVTIRNTKITSGDYYPIRYNAPYTGLLVEDTEIAGTSTDVTSAISFGLYTARRVNVHGSADGLKVDNDATVEDSYIHDLATNATTHNDGFQTTGGSNVTLRHNTCKLSTMPTANACIQMGTEWAGNSNWLVTNNLFDGGGYIINARAGGTNLVFSNNRFTHNYTYGTGVGSSGSTWTGNYYDDNGATIN
jgi:hypothetical protein